MGCGGVFNEPPNIILIVQQRANGPKEALRSKQTTSQKQAITAGPACWFEDRWLWLPQGYTNPTHGGDLGKGTALLDILFFKKGNN